MGGWSLAVGASGLWLGILVAGMGRGPAVAMCAVALAAGALGAAAVVSTRRRFAGRSGAVLAGAMAVVCFGLLGYGLAGVHQAHVRGSPLGRFTGHLVVVDGTLATDPEQGSMGW